MKARATGGITAAFVGLLVLGAGARSLAATGCEFSKLRTAGGYGACRLSASARAVRAGDAPDFNACNARFLAKWRRAEAKGRGRCPSQNDQTAIQLFVIESLARVASAL